MSEFGKDINVPSRKGVFIPDITVEMFRNAPLEVVEELLAIGEMEDISLPSAQPWIPVTEQLPEEYEECLVTYDAEIVGAKIYPVSERIYPELVWWDNGKWTDGDGLSICVKATAWMPLPEPPEVQ